MATQTYSQIFPASVPTGPESLLATDVLSGKYLLVQNNTSYDSNLLIWKDQYPNGRPISLVLRAGGSVTYGGDLGYFEVYSAGQNSAATGIKPPGFGGGYVGKGAINQAGLIGYFAVMAWDQAIPIQIPQSNFSQVSATIGGSLPTGANNIGSVDVHSLPALPAGSNNIGSVDVDSLPALPAGSNNIGSVDVDSLPALPAGTNTIGKVGNVYSIPAPTDLALAVQAVAGQKFGNVGSLPGCQNQVLYLSVDAATSVVVEVSPTGLNGDWYIYKSWDFAGAGSTAFELPPTAFVQVSTTNACTLTAKIGQVI